MNQIAHPIDDVSTGNWTPTPVYGHIDEDVASTADLVASSINPAGDAFIVKLTSLLPPQPEFDPGSAIQSPTLTVQLRQTEASASALIELLQNTDPIADKFVDNLTTSFVNHELLLTKSELQHITDYQSLRVKVTAFSGSGPDCPIAQQITSVRMYNGTRDVPLQRGFNPYPDFSDIKFGEQIIEGNTVRKYGFTWRVDGNHVVYHWGYHVYVDDVLVEQEGCSGGCGSTSLEVDGNTMRSTFGCGDEEYIMELTF